MQNSFSYQRFALRLVLKQRHKRTRKWPIENFVPRVDFLCARGRNQYMKNLTNTCKPDAVEAAWTASGLSVFVESFIYYFGSKKKRKAVFFNFLE